MKKFLSANRASLITLLALILLPFIVGLMAVNLQWLDLVHKFKHQPTEAEIDDFGRTFGKAYKEMKGSLVKERHSLLERFCDRPCGQMCCIVVDAENPPI